MKIIKIYDGSCEGYRVPAHKVFDNIRELAKDHGRDRREKYYILEEINYSQLEKEIQKELNIIKKEEIEIEKQRLLKEREKIEKQLNELN